MILSKYRIKIVEDECEKEIPKEILLEYLKDILIKIEENQSYQFNEALLFAVIGEMENLKYLILNGEYLSLANYYQNEMYVKTESLDVLFSLYDDHLNNYERIVKLYWILNFFGLIKFSIEPLYALDFIKKINWDCDFENNDAEFNSGFLSNKLFSYGSEDVFNFHSKRAICIAQEIIKNGTFEELLIYFGFERWLCSLDQENNNFEKIIMGNEFKELILVINKNDGMMGKFRFGRKVVLTNLLKARLSNAINMLKRIAYKSTQEAIESGSNSFIFEGSKMRLLETLNEEEYILEFFRDDEISSYFSLNSELFKNEKKCEEISLRKNITIDEVKQECGFFTDIPFTDFDLEFSKDLYQKALSGNFEDIIILHREFCLKVFHIRGGGTIAEWFALSLFEVFGKKFKRWDRKGNSEPWSMAVTSGQDYFIENYPAIFIPK